MGENVTAAITKDCTVAIAVAIANSNIAGRGWVGTPLTASYGLIMKATCD